ncbi:hypothetical protein HYV49_00655 [Candidatus Pacearchaeota archaeon]|nr:hypothetical protein [Candidatus Pacearchaeota archaeon]
MKRKKRLEKGIISLEEQIRIHEEKLQKAKEKGFVELATYYEKDIARLKKQKLNKETKL